MNTANSTYIIFGASGDLAKRYILPALKNMNYTGTIVPISRTDYSNLKNLIKNIDGEKIFHLAIPPSAVNMAVEIISNNFGRENIKIVLEKPFGNDLKSAEKLVEWEDKYFKEDQIYRVDHYLVKKSLKKIITENWERENMASLEIIASEKIDIEGRVNFYEPTGALKDFVQSHLLEMAAVTLARSFDINRREEALKNLAVVCDVTTQECVLRGQYEGYKQEVNNPKSMTETFVSINLVSNKRAWHGVHITLTTGKALNEKRTQVIIKYKNGEAKIFNIEHEPDTYERVISSIIEDKKDLFISRGEILETWRILDEIQKSWATSKDDMVIYKKGSTIEEVINI
jgi:glucose-6-phosphate 1-dehydrogenase